MFIGVGIHPIFAVDTNQSIVNKANEENCGCEEIDDRELVILEKQLNRLERYTKLLLVLSKDTQEVAEKCQEILDIISLGIQSGILTKFCPFLENLQYSLWELYFDIVDMAVILAEKFPKLEHIIFVIVEQIVYPVINSCSNLVLFFFTCVL